jgi:hypothetical protein
MRLLPSKGRPDRFGKSRPSAFGVLASCWELSITRDTYDPEQGRTFAIAAGSSRTGTFIKVTGAKIEKARYFKPVYDPTQFMLEVDTAKLTVNPSSGPPGTQVTLSGSRFAADEMLALSFKDKRGKTTQLGSVVTGPTGAFSVVKTVPAGAKRGKGKFSARSLVTAVTASAAFTVR